MLSPLRPTPAETAIAEADQAPFKVSSTMTAPSVGIERRFLSEYVKNR